MARLGRRIPNRPIVDSGFAADAGSGETGSASLALAFTFGSSGFNPADDLSAMTCGTLTANAAADDTLTSSAMTCGTLTLTGA